MTENKKKSTDKNCNCICHHAPGLYDITGMKTKCRHCGEIKTDNNWEKEIDNIRKTIFPLKKMMPLYNILLKLDEVDYMNACNLIEDLLTDHKREVEIKERKRIKDVIWGKVTPKIAAEIVKLITPKI